MFRIFAGLIGLIILLGWTFGGLTIYAGRCLHKRTRRLFIFIMAPNFFKNRRVYLLTTVAYMGSLLFGLFTPPLPDIILLTNYA